MTMVVNTATTNTTTTTTIMTMIMTTVMKRGFSFKKLRSKKFKDPLRHWNHTICLDFHFDQGSSFLTFPFSLSLVFCWQLFFLLASSSACYWRPYSCLCDHQHRPKALNPTLNQPNRIRRIHKVESGTHYPWPRPDIPTDLCGHAMVDKQ